MSERLLFDQLTHNGSVMLSDIGAEEPESLWDVIEGLRIETFRGQYTLPLDHPQDMVVERVYHLCDAKEEHLSRIDDLKIPII